MTDPAEGFVGELLQWGGPCHYTQSTGLDQYGTRTALQFENIDRWLICFLDKNGGQDSWSRHSNNIWDFTEIINICKNMNDLNWPLLNFCNFLRLPNETDEKYKLSDCQYDIWCSWIKHVYHLTDHNKTLTNGNKVLPFKQTGLLHLIHKSCYSFETGKKRRCTGRWRPVSFPPHCLLPSQAYC